MKSPRLRDDPGRNAVGVKRPRLALQDSTLCCLSATCTRAEIAPTLTARGRKKSQTNARLKFLRLRLLGIAVDPLFRNRHRQHFLGVFTVEGRVRAVAVDIDREVEEI